MRNEDIKQTIRKAGLKQWEVAERMGIAESTLILWLRYELTPEKRKAIEKAIADLTSSKQEPTQFETEESTLEPHDTSANIFHSMLLHEAFKKATKNQRLLYVCMKAQLYAGRKPGKDFPDIPQLQGEDKFYFNFALAEKYGLYTRSNKAQFYKDVHALGEHGFIETVSNGKATKSRSIYKFSDKWKD